MTAKGKPSRASGEDCLFVLLESDGRQGGQFAVIASPCTASAVSIAASTSLRVDALAAADARNDHGFTQLHCVTGMAGRQACHRADRRCPGDGDADQFAAVPGVLGKQQRPPSPASRHWRPAGHRRAAPRWPRPSTPSSLPPPPMKMASGVCRPASAFGAAPSTTSSPGTPQAAALRRMRAARSDRPRSQWRASTDRPASIRCRSSRSRRRYPTAVRRAAAPAPTG